MAIKYTAKTKGTIDYIKGLMLEGLTLRQVNMYAEKMNIKVTLATSKPFIGFKFGGRTYEIIETA